MFETPVGRVRGVGLIEGVSALILVFIAMPLKYFAGMPEAVFYVGWVHGILFISYAVVTFVAWGQGHLTAKLVGLAAIAAIVPFGPFLLDKRLKVFAKAQPDTTSAVESTVPASTP